MSLTAKIKDELNQLGIKPKKSLGQNFLINEGVYDKIVAALELKPGETVLEIGSGLGTLTEYLVTAGGNVVGVEKDHQLAEHLKTKFADQKNVTILEDDILKFNPTNYKPQTTYYKLVGNIPYYLTSHLLRIIFENWPKPELIVLMIQKEVAQRIVAKPPNMSLLAVLVQYYARPKIISYVSNGSFYPPPEVDSAIIKLVYGDEFLAFSKKLSTNHKLQTTNFFKVVAAGFAKKRKQLINNLSAGLKMERKIIEQKLLSVQIDSRRRAETLTVEEWQKVAVLFERSGNEYENKTVTPL